MSQGIALRRPRRRPRATVMVPLLSLAILVLGWSVFWAVARGQAAAGLDGFIASEAAHGRRWSCPDRTIDGYPFRIDVSCRGVGFDGVVDGSPGRGHLAGLTARAWLYEPSAVYVLLDGPMTLATADHHSDFTLGWARLGAKLRGVLTGRARAEVVGEEIALDRPGGGGTARRVELHAGPALAPAAADADSVEIALSALAVPGLDAVTGEAAPLDGLLSGIVTHALGDLPDLGPATVERWRVAGGRLDVGNIALTKGPLSLGAAGSLGLDASHRVQGRLDARFGGFEPILKRFGISLGAVQVGGLLANLLGTKPAPAPAPGTVALPVAFADGTVSVGPFKTGLRLPPLY
ncbi:DUF2125 domain-containing protein [Lichenibacterium minor]|uniref:DUF2125 domain-containing protein n=1 Tax=Lichenibacterium minor TaxID=2316528 RepID=A0A4Q2U7V5_9HYPH|nr:DUF2125 domain-containing protein [Lichenibacterium minor]RYC32789.1 DUF2125 domain-containing protein [Lichenibacterium minor]